MGYEIAIHNALESNWQIEAMQSKKQNQKCFIVPIQMIERNEKEVNMYAITHAHTRSLA